MSEGVLSCCGGEPGYRPLLDRHFEDCPQADNKATHDPDGDGGERRLQRVERPA